MILSLQTSGMYLSPISPHVIVITVGPVTIRISLALHSILMTGLLLMHLFHTSAFFESCHCFNSGSLWLGIYIVGGEYQS